jgi:hypothetical protein
MRLRANIFSNKNWVLRGVDCSNDGISSRYDEVILTDEDGAEAFTKSGTPVCKIVKRVIGGEKYVHCQPLENAAAWHMAGGSFVYTTDSRFRELTGSSSPIALHDRVE